MSRLKYILYISIIHIVIMFGQAGAAYKESCNGDSIHIASFPYDIPYSDTCYCIDDIDTSFSTTANAINVGAHHHILITGRKKWNVDGWTWEDNTVPDSLCKLYFGIGSNGERADGIFGIYAYSVGDDINIKNLGIFQIGNTSDTGSVPDIAPDTAWNSTCIRTDDGHDSLKICSSYVSGTGYSGDGYNATAVHYRGYGQGLRIEQSIIYSTTQGWVDRMDYSGAAVLVQPGSGDGRDSIYITDSKVYSSGPGVAFYQLGRANISALNSTFLSDENNTLYTYPDADYTHCAANSFNFDFWCDASGYIRNCSLLCGTQYYGSNGGLIIEGCAPSVDTWAERLRVEDNYVSLNHGMDTHYGSGIVSKFIKFRYQSPSAPISFVEVCNNEIRGYANAYLDDPFTAYGPKIALIYSYVGLNSPGDSVTFHNNWARLIVVDSTTYQAGEPAYMHPPRALAYICVGSNTGTYGVHYYNNHIELAGGAYVSVSDYDNVGNDFTMFHDDSVFILTDTGEASKSTNAAVMFWPSDLGRASYGNLMRDIYWEAPHDTCWNRFTWRGVSGEMDFMVKRTMTATVKLGETPLEGVTVTAINNYGATVINEASDANGEASEVLNVYYEEQNRSGDPDIVDSVDYFPIIFSATYADSTVYDTILSGDNNANSAELIFAEESPDTVYSIMYDHTSIGNILMADATPAEGIKSRLADLGADSLTIRMWDYRCNSVGQPETGWRGAVFDSSTYQMGYMHPQNDIYKWSASQGRFHSLTRFWNMQMLLDDSVKWGYLLVDTVEDTDPNPDTVIAITDFDMIWFTTGPYVWCGDWGSGAGGLINDSVLSYRTQAYKWRDSALLYPDIQFVYIIGTPIVGGDVLAAQMDATEIANQFWLTAFMRDTLVDLANYPNFHVWDFFTNIVEANPAADSFGFMINAYYGYAQVHPNAAWGEMMRDIIIDSLLPPILWPVESQPKCARKIRSFYIGD